MAEEADDWTDAQWQEYRKMRGARLKETEEKYVSNGAYQYLKLAGLRWDFAKDVVDYFELRNLPDLQRLTDAQINTSQFKVFQKKLLREMMMMLREESLEQRMKNIESHINPYILEKP